MTLPLTQRLALIWLALAVLLAALLWWLSPVLAPFLTAGVLAYVLQPGVDRLARPRGPFSRSVAALVVEMAAVLLLLGLFLLIMPALTRELPQLREQIPALAARLNATVSPWLATFGLKVNFDVVSVKAFAGKYFDANSEAWIDALLSSARIGGSYALALLSNAVLLPVVLYYLLVDWPALLLRLQHAVPPRYRTAVQDFARDCDAVLGQYLRGQLMVMGVLALAYTVALALAGFDLALPVGVFTGLAVFIPYIGYGLGLALAVLAAVLQFSTWNGLLLVLAIYGAGQVVESFYLTPRLVGERIGLHPIAVLFALLAFGHLFGFVGVLLALPSGALALVALRRLRHAYFHSRLYTG